MMSALSVTQEAIRHEASIPASSETRPYQHGPWKDANGIIHFRLWAPTAENVSLLLDDRSAQPMEKLEQGWYELACPEASTGSRYRFLIHEELIVPDPASRFQPEDVHGFSEVTDSEFHWQDSEWQGRPWEEAVIYELHVGAFSPEGTYQGVEHKLDYLKELGVTAIELMPIADFSGRHNWGYDGVLPYAPDSAYGRPEELKSLINAAHQRGIMVLLDVVYNHFGPEGNYLGSYAGSFFTEKHHTPWGAAINFEDTFSQPVRRFFIENALYWLQEFHFDGLRFDAVHTIRDDSQKHFLHELAETLRERLGSERHIHLILENEHNSAALLARKEGDKPLHFTAQWNDDFHHNCHVLLTGETDGYYAAYQEKPLERLARCLREGFDYQGEAMLEATHPRGEKSGHLSPDAFVNFLQNHDQIGNRAFGNRLITLAEERAVKLVYQLLLLAPFPPMLFMGEEWGATQPFTFFTDYTGQLADAVREGRRKEFAKFPEFSDAEQRQRIPDPNEEQTFLMSRLDWQKQSPEWLELTKNLLNVRKEKLVPLLISGWQKSHSEVQQESILIAHWQFQAGSLRLHANFSPQDKEYQEGQGQRIWGEDGAFLKGWACRFYLAPREGDKAA